MLVLWSRRPAGEAVEAAGDPRVGGKKKPRRSGAKFWDYETLAASRARLQEAPLSLAKLTKRLTNRTLHHLASLDQTEEGPVRTRNGWGLQYSAGMGLHVSHQPFRLVDPAPY